MKKGIEFNRRRNILSNSQMFEGEVNGEMEDQENLARRYPVATSHYISSCHTIHPFQPPKTAIQLAAWGNVRRHDQVNRNARNHRYEALVSSISTPARLALLVDTKWHDVAFSGAHVIRGFRFESGHVHEFSAARVPLKEALKNI
jgi:hypothetical protein